MDCFYTFLINVQGEPDYVGGGRAKLVTYEQILLFRDIKGLACSF